MFPCWVAQDLSWSLKVVTATIACYGLLIFALCNSLLWACASTCHGFVIFVMCNSLLWAFWSLRYTTACYGHVQQPVRGFRSLQCATACYGWDSHFFTLLVDLVFCTLPALYCCFGWQFGQVLFKVVVILLPLSILLCRSSLSRPSLAQALRTILVQDRAATKFPHTSEPTSLGRHEQSSATLQSCLWTKLRFLCGVPHPTG